MHVNIQHRFNAPTDSENLYYRLKESYRDVRGHVHSLILPNIGFEPELQANQVRKIAVALSVRVMQRNDMVSFDTWADDLTGMERDKAIQYWERMVKEQTPDRFEKCREKAGRYIDPDTVEHTDAREVGPEWLCRQTIDKSGLATFLREQGWSKAETDTALSALK